MTRANFVIETPRGKVVTTPGGTAAYIEWNPNFSGIWTNAYNKAQAVFDSEVLRLCQPYTPLLTGMLISSGILGTVPGDGGVSWIAPYARAQYYSPRKPGSATGGLRGPYWFERMKADNLEHLVLLAGLHVKNAKEGK
jgi:hypothetical protein